MLFGELDMLRFGGHSGLVCASHMSSWKSKNLADMLDGIRVVGHDRESCPSTNSEPNVHILPQLIVVRRRRADMGHHRSCPEMLLRS